MDKRTHDRRAPGDSNRRKSCGTTHAQGELDAHNRTSPLTIDSSTYSSPEKSASLREKALVKREEAIEERESDLQRREAELESQRGESSARRVQEISDAQIVKATQEYRHSKLKQANEHLIIATVESQILVEAIEKSKAAMAHLKQANEHLVIASVESQIKAEEVEKAKEAITHLANHDFLTNLPNRLQLHDRITQAIAVAKRRAEKLAVLFLDLDRFKIVNDTLGHAIGDQLLQEVAQRLKSAIRNSDTVSRQGGDEFILVLSEVNEEKTLALNIEKIHEIITVPYCIASHDLLIGATIGISIFPQDGEDTETLIRNADDAMYYAKENGRNQYQFFGPEIRARTIERQCVEADPHQTAEKKQFVLFPPGTKQP